MRVLVTGGAGFIGSHLCEALAAAGHEVVAFDDLSGGSWGNLEGSPHAGRIHRLEGSVLDRKAVQAAVAGSTQIYHLAAVLGVRRVFDHPVQTIETNVTGTAVVLEAARRSGARVLIASTSEVYGRGRPGRPFVETDDVALGSSLRWGYAAAKATDEYLARGYYREFGLPTIAVRYFNVVGPRQNLAYGAVVPRFITQALAGDPITVYGDGTQVRSFTWVADAVRATMALMETPEALGEVFNVGSGEAVTIQELAERIRHATGARSPIVAVAYEQAFGPGFEDIHYRVPDIGKLQRVTRYEPSLSLDGILSALIEHYSRTAGRTTT